MISNIMIIHHYHYYCLMFVQEFSLKTSYLCILCGDQFTAREKTCRHVCVSPQGNLTCFNQCPDGKRLSNVQCDLLFSDREGHLCDTCGEVFAQKVTLDMHLKSVHDINTERSQKYTCHICGTAFGKRFILEKHIWGKHSAEPRVKAFVCDVCGKSYLEKGGLNRHIRRNHMDGKKFQCQFCSKSYFIRDLWMTHMKQHMGESPHHCRVCNQGFSSKYALTVHMRLHTGEKPYQCKHCDAAFPQKTSLDLHLKKHQGAKESQETDPKNHKSALKGDSGPPEYSQPEPAHGTEARPEPVGTEGGAVGEMGSVGGGTPAMPFSAFSSYPTGYYY